jgi:hypothetical protein
MWSWALAILGTVGMFFVGRKNPWAWVLLFVNESLWVVYATDTKQYGFYFGSAAYMAVYIKNYREWKRTH